MEELKVTDELLVLLNKTFTYEDKKLKKVSPHRIKFNGKYIRVNSKKTVWPSIGAAKNALLHHFEVCFDRYLRSDRIFHLPKLPKEYYTKTPYNSFALPDKFFSNLIKQLEKQNILQFVPVDHETLVSTR